MYYDPSGHFFLSALIIGAIVGAVIGFGGTVIADYADDGEVFNGSVSVGVYIANTLAGSLIGGITGGVGSSTFSISVPTLSFAQASTGTAVLVGGTASITVSGAAVLKALGLIGVTVMGIRIGKSGGYKIDHHYPKDHDPTHVHISGDDGITKIDLNGNPIQGNRPMTPGERKAFWKLYEKIIESLKPFIQ